MGPELSYLLFMWLFVAAVGGAIGARKSRAGAGFFFGALLGPIGWIVVALGPNLGPKCPACFGSIPKGAAKCMHCGSAVAVA